MSLVIKNGVGCYRSRFGRTLRDESVSAERSELRQRCLRQELQKAVRRSSLRLFFWYLIFQLERYTVSVFEYLPPICL